MRFLLLALLLLLAGCANIGRDSGRINSRVDTSKSMQSYGEPSGGNHGINQQSNRSIQVNQFYFGDSAVRQGPAIMQQLMPVASQPTSVNSSNDELTLNQIMATTKPAKE